MVPSKGIMRHILRFYGSCNHIKNEEIGPDKFADWTRHENVVTTEGDAQIVHVHPYRFCVCSDCMAEDVEGETEAGPPGDIIPRKDFHAIMSEVDELHLYGERTRNDAAPIDSRDLTYMLGLAQTVVRLLERGLKIEPAAKPGPAQTFWLVDEHNDWEGETFGFAIPHSLRVEAAMDKWEKSWTSFWGDDKADGQEWSFGSHQTEEYLDAFSAGSDNTYSSRVSYLSDEALDILLTAIEALQPGQTLQLYKGNLSRLEPYPEGEGRGPDDFKDVSITDLWELSRSAPMADPERDDDEDADESSDEEE